MTNNIYYTFWISLFISIVIIFLNAGLFLFLSAILILPVLILHILVGKRIEKLRAYNWLIIFSILNLLLFALVRPDGVHTITDIGWTALLETLGFHTSFQKEFENYYFSAALITIILQVIIDFYLLFLSRKI